MEIAIMALIGVAIGYMMGRQSTRDKQKIEAHETIDKVVEVPEVFRKEEEMPDDPIMEAFNNMMTYDGTEQGES